jgi:hypothetical protein
VRTIGLLSVAALLIGMTVLAHAATEVDVSTKKYCIEYEKQTITVTGLMLVRKIKYDVPEDAPPEGRGGSVTIPMLILDQPMCAYGGDDEEESSVWALHFLDVDDCYLRRWSSTPVRVTGTIYHANNWHHHTQVLFRAKRIEGLKGKLPPCAVRSR